MKYLTEADLEFGMKHFMESVILAEEDGKESTTNTGGDNTGDKGKEEPAPKANVKVLMSIINAVKNNIKKFNPKNLEDVIKAVDEISKEAEKGGMSEEELKKKLKEVLMKNGFKEEEAEQALKLSIFARLIIGIRKALDSVKRFVKDHKLLVFGGLVALGLAAAAVIYIIKKRKNVNEAIEYLNDDFYFESVILEQASSGSSILGKLYDAFKVVERGVSKTGDEVSKIIAKILATFIFLGLLGATFGLFARPLAKLFIKLDAKWLKQDESTIINTLTISKEKKCQIGRLFRAYVVVGNVIWATLRFDKALEYGSFCEFIVAGLKPEEGNGQKDTDNQQVNNDGQEGGTTGNNGEKKVEEKPKDNGEEKQ